MLRSQTILGLLMGGNSTSLSTLKSIEKIYNISFIFTDHDSKEIIRYAKKNKAILYIGSPRSKSFDKFFQTTPIKKPDIIFAVGYKYIVNSNIYNFAKIITLNIHGSLLPKYKGRGPLVRAIMNGDKFTGITVHEIDDSCDGGRILFQKKIKLPSNFTGWQMLKKYTKIYPKIIQICIEKVKRKNFKLIRQKTNKNTYLSVTEEDRTINWNTNSKIIYNKIRAFSKPFNGSITYFKNKKIYINDVKIIKIKKKMKFKNGTILRVIKKRIHVKTNNNLLSISFFNINDLKFILINDRFI